MTQTRLGELREADPGLHSTWGKGGEGRSGEGDRLSGGFDGQRTIALLRLALIVGALVFFFVVYPLPTIFVVSLLVIIMLHELGHFTTAKWSDMLVTEYFVGFGPRIWSFRRGETEYGIKAIPAGGYVKVVGMTNIEEVDPADEPRTYRQKSFPRRMSVALAGSAVHFILAFALLWGLYSFAGTPDNNQVAINGFTRVGNGPSVAEMAGFKGGDVILSVDGKHLTGDSLATYIKENPGRHLDFVVRRDNRDVHLSAVPRNVNTSGAHPDGRIGVMIGAPLVTVNPGTAIARSAREVGAFSWDTVKGIGAIFSPHGLDTRINQVLGTTGNTATANQNRPLSVIGVVRLSDQAAQAGATNVLSLLVFLNIFLGIFNLLPILPLDGGHVAIAIYERVRSRHGRRYYADASKLMPVAAVAVVVLVLVGVTALYLDVAHPLSNPFQ